MENVAQHPGFKYRPDIDGLRAIAVLAVMFYHYGIGNLKGGFVGVDVFFVISGYLITGIIHREIGRGEFTFTNFYERRVRRIFPALFVVLLATLAAGAWLLLPSDLLGLGRSTLATLLFGANVLYWRQSGYFDTSSEYNPLLHTWSLAVEEQFYIGLPILLILVHRFLRGRWLKPVLLACLAASFALCAFMQARMPGATFFLSPFRAWELLLGSLLAVGALPQIHRPAVRSTVSWIALAVLLWSLWSIEAGPEFPGWQAAIPVLATGALLHAGAAGTSQIQRLLSLRPMVFVGLISYSLYLWHWPLLVFARYRNAMQPLEPWVLVLLALLSLLLAALSYHYIEQPLRRWRRPNGRPARTRVFAAATTAGLLLVVAGAGLSATHGLPSRMPAPVLALDAARLPVIPYQGCNGKPVSLANMQCRIGVAGDDHLTLVWGDSWAMAWAPALDAVLNKEGRSGVLALRSACAPLPGVDNLKSPTCIKRNAQVMDWIRQHRPERVILVAAWPAWVNNRGAYPLEDTSGVDGNSQIFNVAYPRTVDALKQYVQQIVVIGPTPGAADALPYREAMHLWRGAPAPEVVSRQQYEGRIRNFWVTVTKHADGVQRVNPAPWFCNASTCRYKDAHNRLLYRDGDHLNLAGAQFVASYLLQSTPDAPSTRQAATR